jgi:MFS-type transporter involved in bile tolerance (Atg22 family)
MLMSSLESLEGLCFGPFQSFARTVFAELIPPGQEARFFGVCLPHCLTANMET